MNASSYSHFLLYFLLRIILFFSFVLLTFTINAEPPKEVIRTCHLGKPTSKKIQFDAVAWEGNYDNIEGCDNNTKVTIGDSVFYNQYCDDGQYFVAGNRKKLFSKAINRSNTSLATPHGLGSIADWHLITLNHQAYLCIESAYGENGWAAAVGQYYIAENILSPNRPLNLYFYFFDKKFIEQVRDRGWTNG